MVDISLILNVVFFAVSLVGAFFGTIIINRCKRELRATVLSLTIILIFFVAYYLIGILNLINLTIINMWVVSLHAITISLILLALININKIIKNIKK